MADAAPRIADVPVSTRNDVDVKMGNGLTSGRPIIVSNIEPVRTKQSLQKSSTTVDASQQRRLLRSAQFIPPRGVARRHDQKVAFGYRKAVPNAQDF